MTEVFKAATVDEAKAKAAKKFGKDTKSIRFEILEEGSKGFLGIGKKDAVVKATYEAPAAAPAAPKPAAKPAGPAGANAIKAPMPGNIIKVNVKAGASVKKGDVLCVLEAMKMENDIMAPADGVVASVEAAQGSSVATDAVLVTLN